MARIWLNHWFSTAYWIARLVREGIPDVFILGTGRREESPMRSVCDRWEKEPDLRGADYAGWCLEYCRRHDVDVFLPGRGALEISRLKAEFGAAGTRVMVEEPAVMELLNHKDQAYAFFRQEGIGLVPDHAVATDLASFEKAYRGLAGKWGSVCFKLVRDVGGSNYRRIDSGLDAFEALREPPGPRMTLDAVLEALGSRESFPPVLLMPLLPGDEASVDCLMTEDGLLAIPRYKDATRIERILFDEEVLGYCADLHARLPLEHPCNVQFRYCDGVPYILEVNTRMSGGVQLSCLAAGANIPAVAAGKLLGRRVPWTVDKREKLVTHIETPLVL